MQRAIARRNSWLMTEDVSYQRKRTPTNERQKTNRSEGDKHRSKKCYEKDVMTVQGHHTHLHVPSSAL
jgi:hypothetical protein